MEELEDPTTMPRQSKTASITGQQLVEKQLRKKAQKVLEEKIKEEEATRKRLQELGMAFLAGCISSALLYGIFRSYQAAHSDAN